MGTGFAHGIWIRDVGVVQNAWGKPEVAYSPRGEKVRRKLGIGDGHVTLTDEAGSSWRWPCWKRHRRKSRRTQGEGRAQAHGEAPAKARRR